MQDAKKAGMIEKEEKVDTKPWRKPLIKNFGWKYWKTWCSDLTWPLVNYIYVRFLKLYLTICPHSKFYFTIFTPEQCARQWDLGGNVTLVELWLFTYDSQSNRQLIYSTSPTATKSSRIGPHGLVFLPNSTQEQKNVKCGVTNRELSSRAHLPYSPELAPCISKVRSSLKI